MTTLGAYGSGKGAVVTFLANPVSLSINNISFGDKSYPVIDVSDLSAGNFMEKLRGDLLNHAGVTLTGNFDPQHVPNFAGMDIDTITVTWPLRRGQLTPTIFSGEAFVTSFGVSQISANNVMQFTLGLEWTGDPPPAFTPSTPST